MRGGGVNTPLILSPSPTRLSSLGSRLRLSVPPGNTISGSGPGHFSNMSKQHKAHEDFNGSPIAKALTCMKIILVKTNVNFVKETKMTILSRRLIFPAILLHEQFTHHTHRLYYVPNTQFLSTQQRLSVILE